MGIKRFIINDLGLMRKKHLQILRNLQSSFMNHKSHRGFTLIELMVAISIVAVLATVGLIIYSQAQMQARDAKRKQDLRAIGVALELFYQQNRQYPVGTGAGNWNNSSSGSNSWLPGLDSRYINTLPLDPLNSGVHIYSYWNDNASINNSWCRLGFMLTAQLENVNDPDAGREFMGAGGCSLPGDAAGFTRRYLYSPNVTPI